MLAEERPGRRDVPGRRAEAGRDPVERDRLALRRRNVRPVPARCELRIAGAEIDGVGDDAPRHPRRLQPIHHLGGVT